MRLLLISVLLVGALLAFGCLGGEKPQASLNETPAAPASNPFPTPTQPSSGFGNNATSGNGTAAGTGPNAGGVQNTPTINSTPSAPSTAPSGPVVWDPEKAMKVSMLRTSESLAFDGWKLRLDGITFSGKPLANYRVLDSSGQTRANFTLGQNGSARFTTPNGEEYLFVAIFIIGEGRPNSVQTQVYRVADLTAAGVAGQIGQPQNSYTLAMQHPAPALLANQSVGVGETVSAEGRLGVELKSIDRSTRPAGASLRILDGSGAEIGTTALLGGQMVEVRLDKQNRYDVVLQPIDALSEQASLQIYRVLAFQNATYTVGRSVNQSG